ncbi:MAG: GLPGLI family protein [Flavipsychrobacter sp.]|nr:GLPGLI family protein [Flavipsychrobacter sp.]
MKQLIYICCLLGLYTTAQAQYTVKGKIEFEKKMNIHRQFQDESEGGNNDWFERMKTQIPKFSVSYFDMYFNGDKVIYKPGKESEQTFKMFGEGPATKNTVYTDLKGQKVNSLKQIYEQKYNVEDSMRVLKWVIKDEIRTIANFKCRKAVSKICDSVYVVAFYTDDIMVSGGPEMFSGLPGMILELAIPRLYTTWVATKVELLEPSETDFAFDPKGKKVTQKELIEQLQSSFKNWGKYAARSVWWCVL